MDEIEEVTTVRTTTKIITLGTTILLSVGVAATAVAIPQGLRDRDQDQDRVQLVDGTFDQDRDQDRDRIHQDDATTLGRTVTGSTRTT